MDYLETSDPANLHRRDLNVGPVILDDGSEGFAVFGGVFQVAQNLPFRNPIYFDASSMTVDTGFEAQFGHYTQPMIPLYDETNSTMHTVFIGGMNQYFYDETDETIKEDRLVPFVDDVTAISRNDGGSTVETVMPITLPVLIGSNSVFFPNDALDTFGNGVIKLDEISGRTLVGHMVGGIEASEPNAGTFGQPTVASDRVFAVYVTGATSAENDTPLSFEVLPPSPNPFAGETRITVRLDAPQQLSVDVFDMLGRRVATLNNGELSAGPHTFVFDAHNVAGGVYIARVAGRSGVVSRRLVHAE